MKTNTPRRPFLIIILSLFALVIPARAASWYIDSSATGAASGKSWKDAWTSLGSMNGLAAGDIVFISGGPSGSSRTYELSGEFTSLPGFRSGTTVSPVTYKIGQDSAHNGTAIFHRTTTGSQWLFGGNNYIVSGDAGDGQMHFKVENYRAGLTLNGSSNIRVSYVNFEKMPTMGIVNPGTRIELDHCYIEVNDPAADRALYVLSSGTDYDSCLIHDNTIRVPNAGNGMGADALQINGSGYSIYNNNVYGYATSYTGSQHQDGWQATGNGSYIKVYNNLFVDLTNYAIFQEPAFGGYAHSRIFNNIVVRTAANKSQGIAVAGTSANPIDDVVVSNNLSDGYYYGITFRDPSSTSNASAFKNCVFYNNVSLNSGDANIVDANISSASNVHLTPAQATLMYADYLARSVTNDYRLKSTATTLIGAGKNAYSYFTIDKINSPRASSGTWDIGPYVSNAVSSLIAPTNARISSSGE